MTAPPPLRLRLPSVIAAACTALAVSLALSTPSHANTGETRAQRCAYVLTQVLEKRLKSGADLSTVTMDQVLADWNPRSADRLADSKFADRFELLRGHGPVDPVTQEKLVALTAYQISNHPLDAVGRYVTWQKGDELRMDWETEDRLRTLMDSAHQPLLNKGVWRQHGLVWSLLRSIPFRYSWIPWLVLAFTFFLSWRLWRLKDR